MNDPRIDKLGHKWPLLGNDDLKPDGSAEASCLLCGATISTAPNHVGPDGFLRRGFDRVDPAVKKPCRGKNGA